jgi:two-component system response regulator LytT
MAGAVIDYLIVEDEPLAAQRLERFVREALGARAGEASFARNLEEAVAQAARLSESAVLFLDLNLFGAEGFDIFEIDVRSPARTIIVSADQSRAIEAFSHGVIDFIAKPFTRDRVAQAVERALSGRDPLAAPVKQLSGAPPEGGVAFAMLSEIVALHGADDYVEIELSSGRRLLTRKSLNLLETMLGDDFFRIHRSHIANRIYIDAFKAFPGSSYKVSLKSGDSLPVGRNRTDAVKRWLEVP